MRLFSFALFLGLALSSHAQWWIGMTKTSETSISYHPGKPVIEGNNFKSLDEALQKLLADDEVSSLHDISMGEFFKLPEYHDELLAQFQKLMPEKTKAAMAKSKLGNFHNYPLRPHLKEAVLEMKQFKNLTPLLAKHGLKVDRVNCEKFHSFKDKDGKTKLFGMGLWIGVTPIDFGFKEVNKDQDSSIQIGKMTRVGKEFIAEFTVYVGKEDVRLYGKWSAEHKCYIPEAYQIGYIFGNGWKTTEKVDGKKSFKLKKNTSHKLRVKLGEKHYSRACLRLHGPTLFLDSSEFNLYDTQ